MYYIIYHIICPRAQKSVFAQKLHIDPNCQLLNSKTRVGTKYWNNLVLKSLSILFWFFVTSFKGLKPPPPLFLCVLFNILTSWQDRNKIWWNQFRLKFRSWKSLINYFECDIWQSAFENDLREGDKILEINNISIEEFSDIPKAIGNNPSINILIERNNQIIEKNFDLKFNSELNRYIIGISSPQNPIIDKYNL